MNESINSLRNDFIEKYLVDMSLVKNFRWWLFKKKILIC